MIEIKKLKVAYGRKTVLENLDLTVQKGTVHGLVGLNGAGKTTLLNTVYGIKKKSSGSIGFHGTAHHKKDIAYLETDSYFYPSITGGEYLNIFRTQNKSFDIEKRNEMFELPLKTLIEQYSTGMKKKLAFLGILCLNKPIVILDEPFNGIDLESVQKIKSILLKMKNQKTILITSHILESLTGICDRISYLENGKIRFTKEKGDYNTLEKEIFSLHQDKIDEQINNLLGQVN